MKRILNIGFRLSKGLLDGIPFPNVHDIVKSVRKRNPNASFKELIISIIYETDWIRVFGALLILIAVVKGWLTVEKARLILEFLNEWV